MKEVTAINVTYSDIDMSHDEGITTLHVRLTDAARKICGSKDSNANGATIESRKTKRSNDNCFNEAMKKAVQNIDNDKLTALHAQ